MSWVHAAAGAEDVTNPLTPNPLAFVRSPADMSDGKMWTASRAAMYTAFSRPAWAACLAALCILWFSAPRNLIARALSAQFW